MGVLRDIGLWLWRLGPANPILVRVVAAGGKRKTHFWWRFGYLVTLFVVVVIAQNTVRAQGDSLADLAKSASQVFMFLSNVQLLLMCFVAPIFAAGAITQEKDSNTFNILLTTPLSDGQIVLGSLLSRLYFVWVLLLSGLPIFCILMLLGGVTTAEIFESFALAAATALFTGSLAIAISVLKVGTQRTIFSFFLGIALYLLGVFALASWPGTWLPATEAATSERFGWRMSWLAPFHPFLALLVVTGQTPAPDPQLVQHYAWPWPFLLRSPQYAYLVITGLASAAIIMVSLLSVRRMAKSESGIIERIAGFFRRETLTEERRHKPRRVWQNPIAWREAATRGSAAGRSGLRWAFAVIGILAGLVLLVAYERGWNGMTVADVRKTLTSLIWIELAIILLVVTNTAAATLTRERDAGTMDLLLATPMTSKYIIGGMLRGLVSFVVPLITVPTVTLLLFVAADTLRNDPKRVVTTPEALVLTPTLILAFCAAAAMVGLTQSLQSRKTVQAVMRATGVVMLAAAGLSGCLFAVTRGGAQVASVFTPLGPFHAVWSIVDYGHLFANELSTPSPNELMQARVMRGVMSLISAAVYAGVVVMMYNHLVRNFDMTVRKQSAQG